MGITSLLNPIDFDLPQWSASLSDTYSLVSLLKKNQSELSLDTADVVLLSIAGDEAGDAIRTQLYALNRIAVNARILDLGELKRGESEADFHHALSAITSYCERHRILMILMHADRSDEYAVLNSYEEREFNLVRVDGRARMNLSASNHGLNHMGNLLSRFKNIFTYTGIALQKYFIDNEELTLLNLFDSRVVRLGSFRDDNKQVEPIFRNAHSVSFDVESIRSQDFPAQRHISANGLRSEEACALAKYIGLGGELRNFAIYGVVFTEEELKFKKEISVNLAAQIIWHVLESYLNGVLESPHFQQDSFEEYVVRFPDMRECFTFYRSKISNRWWLKIYDERFDEDLFVPCLESDYQETLNMDIPEIWLRYIKKMKR
ncbi:MAG: hypothetical protein ACK5IJ_09415 [Mangrovibacterium sp.]